MIEASDSIQLHRESFVMYRSFAEALSNLSNDDYATVMRAICSYALDGVNPSFDKPLLQVIWTLIEPQLKANIRKAFNGSKGGKVSRKKQETSKSKQKQANANANVNANNNVKRDTNVSREPTIQTLKPEQAEKFDKFNSWLKEKCPFVAKMSKQLSFSLMETLMSKYGKDKVFEILRNMDNYKKGGKTIDKCYTSVYQTANNWLKADVAKEGGNQ